MSCQALRVHWQPRVLQLPTNQLCSAPCILRLAPLQVVFTSLALFNVLLGPINALPWVLNGCGQPCGLLPCAPCILLIYSALACFHDSSAYLLRCPHCRVVEAIVSVRRVSEFLSCPETAGPTGGLAGSEPHADQPAINISGSFTWGGSATPSQGQHARPAAEQAAAPEQAGPVLHGLSLQVPAGSLVALTGTVGSGKSSLLAAALGEMLPCSEPQHGSAGQRQHAPAGKQAGAADSSGFVAPGHTVAYVPQDPWVLHGTVR